MLSLLLLPLLALNVLSKPLAKPAPLPQTTGTPTEPNPDAPPPDQIYVKDVDYNGIGCPPGSAVINLTDKQRQISLIFSQYYAQAAPGLPPNQAVSNCQVNILLQYPGGFQYSVLGSQYFGYVDLDKDVLGTQRSTYYFPGEGTKQANTQTIWRGPLQKDFTLVDEVPISSTIFSPCGRSTTLNINSQVRIDNSRNRQGQGVIFNFSEEHYFKFIVGIQWQKCVTK